MFDYLKKIGQIDRPMRVPLLTFEHIYNLHKYDFAALSIFILLNKSRYFAKLL